MIIGKSRQGKAQMTGIAGNTPILTNNQSYDTMTPTTMPTNATIIK